jgi:hypothetical protein
MGQINGGNHENGPFIEVSYLSAGNGERAKGPRKNNFVFYKGVNV